MTWDLSALYTGFDDPAMEKDWEDADRLAKETAACVDIPEFLKGLEAFTGLTQKLGSMVLLTLAADADNEAALGRYDRLMRLDVALETLQSELNLSGAWAARAARTRCSRRIPRYPLWLTFCAWPSAYARTRCRPKSKRRF